MKRSQEDHPDEPPSKRTSTSTRLPPFRSPLRPLHPNQVPRPSLLAASFNATSNTPDEPISSFSNSSPHASSQPFLNTPNPLNYSTPNRRPTPRIRAQSRSFEIFTTEPTTSPSSNATSASRANTQRSYEPPTAAHTTPHPPHAKPTKKRKEPHPASSPSAASPSTWPAPPSSTRRKRARLTDRLRELRGEIDVLERAAVVLGLPVPPPAETESLLQSVSRDAAGPTSPLPPPSRKTETLSSNPRENSTLPPNPESSAQRETYSAEETRAEPSQRADTVAGIDVGPEAEAEPTETGEEPVVEAKEEEHGRGLAQGLESGINHWRNTARRAAEELREMRREDVGLGEMLGAFGVGGLLGWDAEGGCWVD